MRDMDINSIDVAEAQEFRAEGFSEWGVPLTLDAALEMSNGQIQEALVQLIAYLDAADISEIREGPLAEDGSLLFDSHLGFNVFVEFTAHLGKIPLDLAAVERKYWTSLAGIALVLEDAFKSISAKAN
jgi:hypothetical protein